MYKGLQGMPFFGQISDEKKIAAEMNRCVGIVTVISNAIIKHSLTPNQGVSLGIY